MKTLCICQYGHSRSVAMARFLHETGEQAVACGWMTAPSALETLARWADRIIVLEPQFATRIPQEYEDKLVVIDVGPDIWSNPYHPELAKKIETLYNEKYKQ